MNIQLTEVISDASEGEIVRALTANWREEHLFVAATADELWAAARSVSAWRPRVRDPRGREHEVHHARQLVGRTQKREIVSVERAIDEDILEVAP